MIAVQLDDVYHTQVCVAILTIIVRQESLGDVVDRLLEGYNGEILFLDYVEVPCLDNEGIYFELTICKYL